MTYTVTVIEAPTLEPITLDQAKRQLRLEDSFTHDDEYVFNLISIVRDKAESYCNRYFTTQTVALNYDEPLPIDSIKLPFPNIDSIVSIKYRDGDNEEATLPPSDYALDAEKQVIYQVNSWPQSLNYRVEIVTGAPVVFDSAKQAMLMMLTDLYELRTETVLGVSVAENPAVKALLYPYRINLGI